MMIGRTTLLVFVAAAVLASASSAAAKPGWTLAKTSAYLELKLRIDDQDIVDQARDYLRQQKQLGGPNGIATAQSYLRVAVGGLIVERASCLGTKAAPGGFVSFRCRLLLSDDLGFTGRSTGVWKRVPSGKWDWFVSTYSRAGIGPAEWLDNVR